MYLRARVLSAANFHLRWATERTGADVFHSRERRANRCRRENLEAWRGAGAIEEDSYYLLLAAIIEGADRVANTAGVYASYMKRWQPNAQALF